MTDTVTGLIGGVIYAVRVITTTAGPSLVGALAALPPPRHSGESRNPGLLVPPASSFPRKETFA